jgi:hypothetical protein
MCTKPVLDRLQAKELVESSNERAVLGNTTIFKKVLEHTLGVLNAQRPNLEGNQPTDEGRLV